MQGFCAYMNNNAEKLRKKFVDFKGKKLLTVIRDSGFMLRNGTDFESIFADFSQMLKENIGVKNHFNLVPKFSTTGHLE